MGPPVLQEPHLVDWSQKVTFDACTTHLITSAWKPKGDTRMSDKSPNKQEAIFVAKYIVDFNAYQSAKDAGYAESTALKKAAMWVCEDRDKSTKPWVWDAVQAELAKVVERARKTKDNIIEELENLGFSNMMDFYKAGEDGKLELDLSKLTRDQAAALSQVTFDGDKTTIKLVDKRSSLELLGKHLGMWPNRHELGGPDGGPIEVRDCSRLDVARRIAFALNLGLREAMAEKAAEQG